MPEKKKSPKSTKSPKAAKPPKAVKKRAGKSDAKRGEKELKAVVERLQAQLDKAEGKVEQWKGRAKDHGARAKKLEKKLARSARPAARRTVQKVKDATAETIAVTATAIDPSDSTRPNESWTVTRLRAEARTRGIVNYSRKTKAQLIEELTAG